MPTALQDEIALALRDYIVDGDSGSGAYTPAIPDLRDILDGMAIGEQWITAVENFLGAADAAAMRTAAGVGSGDSPTFTGLTLSGGLTVDTSTFRVDNSNNRVGVGTATPAVGLDVQVAAEFASTVDIAGVLTTEGDVDLGGSSVFVNASNGRVGIGTLTPGTALEIAFGGVWVRESTSSTALKVTQTGSGIVALFEDSDSTDSSPFVILTDGRAVQGYTAAIAAASGVTPQFQVHSTGGETGYSATRWSSDASGPILYLNKSRGSAVNSRGGLSINDTIATINFGGDDGTNFIPAVQLLGQVDATPGTNDMAGRFVIKLTPDGSASPGEAARLSLVGSVPFLSLGGDTDTGIAYPGSNELSFWSGAAEAFRIEENGYAVFGHTNALASYAGTPKLQVVGTTNSTAQIGIFRSSEDTAYPLLSIVKTRGTNASPTTAVSGDGLGALAWQAFDGTAYVRGAQILVEADATVATSQVPGRMRFYTSSTGGTLTEQMRIDSAGSISFYNLASAAAGTAVSMTGTSFHTNTSSMRYKQDVEDLVEDDLSNIFDMRPVSYRSRSPIDDPNERFLGFIAEDMVNADPRLVEFKVIDGERVPESVRYDRITVLLVGAVKNLADRIAALEAA